MTQPRIFDSAITELERNMRVRETGAFNCIPFPNALARFRYHIPGLQRKNYVIITASSGVAKSKFAKFFYVISPHDFIVNNPQLDMKLNTMYFCLEENKRSFIQSLICNRLYAKYGIRMDIKQLKSVHFERYLNAETLEKVIEMREYFYQLEDNLIIIDDIRHPTGIYKAAEREIEKHGHWTRKMMEFEIDGAIQEREVNDEFIWNHPNHYFQVIVDHASLINKEKGLDSLWEAMSYRSAHYNIRLRDKYGASITDVQQQEAAKEKQQWTNQGRAIEEKVEPSLDGLADNKTTQRDADEIIGIFSPHRYKIANHRGYDIELLRDNYRSAIILKCRDGSPDMRAGLFFDGATNNFMELPKADRMTETEYNRFLSYAGRIRVEQEPGIINFG